MDFEFNYSSPMFQVHCDTSKPHVNFIATQKHGNRAATKLDMDAKLLIEMCYFGDHHGVFSQDGNGSHICARMNRT
jgi:hypothetical protein